MINPIFRGIIKQGKFIADNQQRFMTFLYSKEGKVVECIIRPETKLRSRRQLNYYWGVVIPILCESTGYDRDSMHEVIKGKFYPKVEILETIVPIRSSKMTTIQIEERNNAIREWASEFLDCYIPLPNEVDYELLEVNQ